MSYSQQQKSEKVLKKRWLGPATFSGAHWKLDSSRTLPDMMDSIPVQTLKPNWSPHIQRLNISIKISIARSLELTIYFRPLVKFQKHFKKLLFSLILTIHAITNICEDVIL